MYRMVIVVAILPVVAGVIWYANKRAGEPSPTPAAVTCAKQSLCQESRTERGRNEGDREFRRRGSCRIIGKISNTGDRALSRVDLNCVFYDVNGLVCFGSVFRS